MHWNTDICFLCDICMCTHIQGLCNGVQIALCCWDSAQMLDIQLLQTGAVTSHRVMCCIWSIQTVIWCILVLLLNQSQCDLRVSERWIGWSYYDLYINSSMTQWFSVKVNMMPADSSDWTLHSDVCRAWYSSVISQFVSHSFFVSVSKCTIASLTYLSHCLSGCIFFTLSHYCASI